MKITLVVSMFAGLIACQRTGERQPTEESNQQASPAVARANNSTVEAMNLNQQLSSARQDLSDRLGIETETITIRGARQVTWSSGDLGCPKPGMNYTQALVPGVLIFLDVDGRTYGYHARKGGKPFHCPTKQAVMPSSIQKEDLA
jgi:hypothetical protein